MSDNIILNDKDESIGYYNDLYKVFENVIVDAIKSHDIEMAKEQLEYLEEMSEWTNYEGLLVLSMNNGMGFTCRPYKQEEGE